METHLYITTTVIVRQSILERDSLDRRVPWCCNARWCIFNYCDATLGTVVSRSTNQRRNKRWRSSHLSLLTAAKNELSPALEQTKYIC